MDVSSLPPLRTDPIIRSRNLLGVGSMGFVFKSGDDRVLKRPATYAEKGNFEMAYINDLSIEALADEAHIYRRLGQHVGIIQYFGIAEHTIELAFANQGDLWKYMEQNPRPTDKVVVEWIRCLADAFAYVHSHRVVVDDIDLRNILIHNNRPKLSDFNQSFLLPLDTDMEHFSIYDINAHIEILHLGCLFYSISTWSKFKYDYFDDNRFPNLDELPDTDGIISGMIIRKCWTRGYANMELLRKDVEGSLPDELRARFRNSARLWYV
ncbi:serine/threonine protein kinase [[Emmonsia] crescens]|uniref:Serine/threonine protein kinase n=1 Tax=[Emmonsia] crescens TaxID=73230 RepID=A0A2B7Z7H7_9EURO|nr:serine/threonine protein kinase [Emmonsia crescens]